MDKDKQPSAGVGLTEDKFFELLKGYHGGNPEWWIKELQMLWDKHFCKFSIQSDGGVGLDYDKVREEVVRIHKQYLLPSGTEIIAVAELNDDIANAICSKFSPKPPAINWPKERAPYGDDTFPNGWNACLSACKEAVKQAGLN